MEKQWIIRKAVLKDVSILQECMHSAYTAYQDRMGGIRLPPLDLDYADEISNFPTWVAEFEGKIVGGITMVFEENCASIANIAVHPNFQGKGLGGALMRFAGTTAKKIGYAKLHLATHVLLTENIALYLHLGWSEIARDKVRVYMQKAL